GSAVGLTPVEHRTPGVADRATAVKPSDGFRVKFEAARQRILAARGRTRIGVIGGGAGGVELLLALERRLTRDVAAAGCDPAALAFVLIGAANEILPAFPPRMRRR